MFVKIFINYFLILAKISMDIPDIKKIHWYPFNLMCIMLLTYKYMTNIYLVRPIKVYYCMCPLRPLSSLGTISIFLRKKFNKPLII